MPYIVVGFLSLIMMGQGGSAADTEQERLVNSAEVMQEILNIPDALPQDLLNKAECVAVMPSVKKFAFGVGGSYGKGALVCRTGITSQVRGVRRPCTAWREQVSDSSSEVRQRISSSW